MYVTSATWATFALLPVMGTPDGNPAALAAVFVIAAAQTVACVALLRAGFRTLLGGPRPGRRLVITTVALTAAGLLAAVWALPHPAPADSWTLIWIAAVFGGSLTSALTPVLSRGALAAGIGIGAAFTAGWYTVVGSEDWPWSLPMGLIYVIVVGFVVVADRVSEWMLVLVWQLDAARTVQARLAVAEERLRFARDFHDVLGRNLTLIAVTSDLAAGLARRGDPEAVDKMLQVRGLAHESAREVREVVAGYRAADLDTELAGARSVLRAAGITTRVIGDSTCLPGDAQTAFAWVLREATTNVIRHSNATTCTIELGIHPSTETAVADTAVLRLRNDGSAPPLDPFRAPGHGLAGLRERVKAAGGDLAAGLEPGGWFTVEARLPTTTSTTAAALDPAP
jgi:two-component system, NarL family, sensor histidine kinase DesK